MGDGDFIRDLHLRFTLEKAHVDNHLFAGRQFVQRLFDGDILQPLKVGIFGIANLIHNINGVAAVIINWVIEGNRILNGIQC